MLGAFFDIAKREFRNMISHPTLYAVFMIIVPVCVVFFFTDLMHEGLPEKLPVGIVDLDNSAMSRKLTRTLDAYQNTKVVARFPNVREARKAMQKMDIYGFLLIPKGTEAEAVAQRQPKVSLYYNASVLLAGSLIYKDMRAVTTLGGAAIGQAKLQALGFTPKQIQAFLQPIVIDTHMLSNAALNYNSYLSTTIIPVCLSLFIILITAFSIGIELKYNTAPEWMHRANNNIVLALLGKFVPQTIVFTFVMWFATYWMYFVNDFPYQCSPWFLFLLAFLVVIVSQGFGIFMFGLVPSLRMSMSVCALWGVLSFSISGFTFPVDAMGTELQMLSWLFPMRSYFQVYQINVLNGFPLYYSWSYFVAMLVFILLPILVLWHIKKALTKYIYIP